MRTGSKGEEVPGISTTPGEPATAGTVIIPAIMADTLFRGYRAVVVPEWIDINDHMNARFYASVIYDAHVLFTDHIGLGEAYVAARHCGKVVVESHLVYERELRLGDEIGVTSRLLAVDDKRMHFAHELTNLRQGYRAALAEQLDLHVDLGSRRAAPLPADIHQRLVALVRSQASMPLPAKLGRALHLPVTSRCAPR